MKHLSKSLLMGLLVSLAGVVFAQSPTPSGRGAMPFSAFDQNGDGSISRQEFESTHAQRQQARNSQGYSASRMSAPPKFTNFDLNGDGGLSPEELTQGQTARMQQRHQQLSGSGQGNTLPRNPGMGRGRGPGRGRNMPSFSEFDLNGDGALQPEEFEQARAQRIRERAEQGYMLRNLQHAPAFSTIDSNGDGIVSSQEFSAAQAQHRQP
jgi:Ca2+-binding EF-hand superfamily protein